MRKMFIVPLVLLLASLTILVACGGTETVVEERIVEVEKKVEPITLKIQAAWPTTNMIYDNLVDFSERVEKMSGGRLIIEHLPSGAIVPAFEIQDATSEGVIDGGIPPWVTSSVKAGRPSPCPTAPSTGWTWSICGAGITTVEA